MMRTKAGVLGAIVLGVVLAGCQDAPSAVGAQSPDRQEIPTFEYDATWPKPLPNNWMTGPIGAMAVDARDHIWIVQRPGGTTNLSERYGLEGIGECCFPAP